MKGKKISLSEIKDVLTRDEMKKVIGGCGAPCNGGNQFCYIGQNDICVTYGSDCHCWNDYGSLPGDPGQCVEM